MTWINVKNKLPKKDNHYLTYSPNLNEKFRILSLHNGHFHSEVTHWKHLKKPKDIKNDTTNTPTPP